MHEQRNLQLIEALYAAFGRGDVAFILEHFAEDIDLHVVVENQTGAPWHKRYAGRAGAASYFEALGGTLEVTHFEARDLAATGDHVYATIDMFAKVRATGVKVDLREAMHHFTFRDGKVVRWRGTEDTAETVRALASR